MPLTCRRQTADRMAQLGVDLPESHVKPLASLATLGMEQQPAILSARSGRPAIETAVPAATFATAAQLAPQVVRRAPQAALRALTDDPRARRAQAISGQHHLVLCTPMKARCHPAMGLERSHAALCRAVAETPSSSLPPGPHRLSDPVLVWIGQVPQEISQAGLHHKLRGSAILMLVFEAFQDPVQCPRANGMCTKGLSRNPRQVRVSVHPVAAHGRCGRRRCWPKANL